MFKKCLIAISVFILAAVSTAHAGGSWNGWLYQDSYPTSQNLYDVKFVTPLKGWMTGKAGTILHTEDGGETWEDQTSGTSEDISRVYFVNENAGWAVGDAGSILHTENGGKTWVKQYDTKAILTQVFFLNQQEGWVTGTAPAGVMYKTRDSGKTWQKVETGINRAITSVYFVNQRTGWILAGEDVYRTTDGVKWEKGKLPIGKLPPRRRPPSALFMSPGGLPMNTMNAEEEGLGPDWRTGDISFANEKQGWATVFQWVFHTEDGGNTWTMQFDTGNFEHQLVKISFRDAQNGCAAGWTIHCTEDGGKTWQERLGAGPVSDNMLGGVILVGQTAGWVVGSGGRIRKTEDNGRSWKLPFPNNCGSNIYFINKQTGWLYEPRSFNRICRTDDGGHTWQKQDIGIKVQNVYFIDGSSGWAIGKIEDWKEGKETNRSNDRITVWGIVKYTTDGGKSWTTQYKESMGKNFYGLYGVSFTNAKIGWVVGDKGVILHTKDGGNRWDLQKSGDLIYSFRKVNFVNSQSGWITGALFGDHWEGIILHTEDGGKHWQNQYKKRDYLFSDLYFFNNDSGWINGQDESGEEGLVLYTEDGGKSWSEKDFKNIGFNSMTFINKERGIIYSENGFILITTDGGKTWNKKKIPLKKYPWHFSEVFDSQSIK